MRCVGLAALGVIGAIAGGEDAREKRKARRKAETEWDEANRARQNAEKECDKEQGRRKKYVLIAPYRSPVFTNSGSYTSSIEYSGVELEREPTPQVIEQGKREARFVDGHAHVIVVGIRGAGKSSFINAFPGRQAEDTGAAPTGEVETALGMRRYLDMRHQGYIWYDAPGADAALVDHLGGVRRRDGLVDEA